MCYCVWWYIPLRLYMKRWLDSDTYLTWFKLIAMNLPMTWLMKISGINTSWHNSIAQSVQRLRNLRWLQTWLQAIPGFHNALGYVEICTGEHALSLWKEGPASERGTYGLPTCRLLPDIVSLMEVWHAICLIWQYSPSRVTMPVVGCLHGAYMAPVHL